MLTPIDEIANQNHLQLIKAAVAFLPPQSQRSLSLLIKLLELPEPLCLFSEAGKSPCLQCRLFCIPSGNARGNAQLLRWSGAGADRSARAGMLFDGIVFRHDAASGGRIVLKCEVL